MLIDIHTHLSEFQDSLEVQRQFVATGVVPDAIVQAYRKGIAGVDRAVLVALDARPAGFHTSNEAVAWMVKQDPKRIVGFASVDPNLTDAPDQLERAVQDLGLRGLKLAPMYQFFAPDAPTVFPLYERALRLGLPILIHQGTSYLGRRAPLEDSLPWRLDRVAREYPELKIVIAHFGFPWGPDVVALIRKHDNVYTDCSALGFRPSFLHRTLVDAYEYGVLDKVLFGSDYPGFSSTSFRDTVLGMAKLTAGTNLPGIPEDKLRDLVGRDSLAVLGVKA